MVFTELPSQGIIAFSGVDAKTFLQGQVTCDLNKITPQQGSLGAHCNLKGRMQSLFRLVLWENTYYMLLPKSMVAATMKDFTKYAMFSKVKIADMSDSLLKIGVWGENATQELAKYDGNESYKVCQIEGTSPRYIVIATAEDPNGLMTILANHQASNEAAWEITEVEAGLPMVYPETIDQLLPHHINLVALHGVSFDKGCYLGQEVVARMQWRGKIKKKMLLGEVVSVSPAPIPGDPVFVENATGAEAPGVVVRVAEKVDGGFLLLMVLDEADEKAHLLSVNGPEIRLRHASES